MKKRGFTLIELLVVIGIIALLVSILMPALGKARELAKRMKCGTQIRGQLQAMALYQNEYKEKNAVIGDSSNTSAYFGSNQYAGKADTPKARWTSENILLDWRQKSGGAQLATTAAGSLYLLVRTQDLVPDMFICPSDRDSSQMSLQEAKDVAADPDIIQNWDDLRDFRDISNISYGYNDPIFRLLTSSATSSSPVIADNSIKWHNRDGDQLPNPDVTEVGPRPNPSVNDFPNVTWGIEEGELSENNHGNSPNHDAQMQNVGFADGHVDQFQTPLAGLAEDNIYSFHGSSSDEAFARGIGQWATTSRTTMYIQANGARSTRDTYIGL